MDSLLITVVISANKGRDVAVYGIPGSYLSTDMDEEVIMILEGRLEELMAMMAPGIYLQLIHRKKTNKKVWYANINKTLFVCLKIALLFDKNLS